MQFILASASPRRKELLKAIGLRAEVVPSKVDESQVKLSEPGEMVARLAMLKSTDVARTFGKGTLVIGADTCVYHNGAILGKPKDSAEAKAMLHALSGDWHEVYTGYCVTDAGTAASVARFCVTRVKFRTLTDAEIDRYVASREPMDKAGAYGIQKLGSLLVERVDGDFYNVVGLPLSALAELLKNEFDVSVL